MPDQEAIAANAEALQQIEEAYREGIRAFAQWFAKNWQQSREEWIREISEEPPSQEWFDGRAAGVESAVDAVEFYFGEVG